MGAENGECGCAIQVVPRSLIVIGNSYGAGNYAMLWEGL